MTSFFSATVKNSECSATEMDPSAQNDPFGLSASLSALQGLNAQSSAVSGNRLDHFRVKQKCIALSQQVAELKSQHRRMHADFKHDLQTMSTDISARSRQVFDVVR
jgi:hypothetical protein